MFKIGRHRQNLRSVHVPDHVPRAWVKGVEDNASRVAEAVESAGALVAKGVTQTGDLAATQVAHGVEKVSRGADKSSSRLAQGVDRASAKVADGAAHAGDRATDLGAQIGGRVSRAQHHAADSALSLNERATVNLRTRLTRMSAGASNGLHRTGDAMLKAQLAKTSRDLAHESVELGEAVDSLNAVIKANRKRAAAGRTRLIGGLAVGAVLMYHLDPEHGRERRAETRRRLASLTAAGR